MTSSLNRLLLGQDSRTDAVTIADAPTLTRGQWAQHCLQLAAALQGRGIRHAALWFEDAALFATALFACWRAGVTAVLAGDVRAQSCDTLDAQVDVWLSDMPLPHVSEQRQWRMEASSMQPAYAANAAPLPAGTLDPHGEVVLCTSGSSGTPKQIRKHWWQLQHEVDALQAQWPINQDGIQCVLGSVSVQHMYGLPFRVLWPLATGVALDRPQRPYPEALQHASLRHGCFVWIASPALLRRLGERMDWAALRGRLHRVYSAGGALPLAVSDIFQQHLGLRPMEIYGSSETGVIAHRSGADDWQPFDGVSIRLNDGALHVQSPWVRPEDGQTADGASLTPDGFQLHGRLDRIVKIEGKRIALPMLENALARHAFVAHVHMGAVIKPVTDATPQRIAALVALSAEGLQVLRQHGRNAVIDALRKPLMAQCEPLAVPRIWRFFAQLPVNAQGKLTQAMLDTALHRPTMPEVQALSDVLGDTPHTRRYALDIPYDLVHFSGHFPNVPVVPGVAQIGWAMTVAQQDLLSQVCADFRFGGMEVLKFQQLVRPGDALQLILRFDVEKRKLHFAFTCGEKVCSSGRIVHAAGNR